MPDLMFQRRPLLNEQGVGVRQRKATIQDNRGAAGGNAVQLQNEHTKNARPSNAEKHQKGRKAKVDADKNKLFQDAKKKGDTRSKSAILKDFGKHK